MIGLRRVVMIVVMIALGLTVTWLLSDDDAPRVRDVVGTRDTSVVDPTGIAVDSKEEENPTVVSFPGELTVEIMSSFEQEDGTLGERRAYTVHMLSGSPTGANDFRAEKPTITFIDEVTGEAAGTVTADEAVFAMSRTVGGRVLVDTDRLSADRFTLTGDVRGAFPRESGDLATLEADRLLVDGELITGPGIVSWSRMGVRLEGTDFTWDGETGRLNYVLDALLVMEPTEEHPGMDLFAPGGLTWTFPPTAVDARTESYGELRGRVSGVARDGSRIGAETVYVHTSTITLRGASVYERRAGDDLFRVTAQRITVQPDDAGVFALAEADGDVLVVSAPFALVPSRLVADYLVMEDEDVSSPGEVTITNGDVLARGTGFDAHLATGRLDYSRDASVSIDPEATSALAGLRVIAPGGMSLRVPPEAPVPGDAVSGKLRGTPSGGVVGTLPDGSRFRGDVFTMDAPSRAYVLDGEARFDLVDQAGQREIEARTIRFETDDAGELALVTATGDVVVIDSPVDLVPTRLVAGRLDITATGITAPGEVTWTHGDMGAVGTGLTWDDTERRLEYEQNALLTVYDPERDLETHLDAGNGLVWYAPKDLARPFSEGQGTFRGPVVGRSSDGSTLETQTLLVDGEADLMRLLGPSTVAWTAGGEPMAVSSDELQVRDFGGTPTVTSPTRVDWVRPDMRGQGEGMLWDEASGRIDITRDAVLEFTGGLPGDDLRVEADGGLTWTAPGPDQAPDDGHGELRGHVRGRTGDGSVFHTEHLVMDGRADKIRMRGMSHYERTAPEGSVRLDASRRMDMDLDEEGNTRWVEAEGDVEAWIWPGVDTSEGADVTHVTGERLVVDQPRHEVTTYGTNARFDQVGAGDRTTVTATESIHVRTEEEGGGISWLRAVRDVHCVTADFDAKCQRLVWNVADDHATLSGDCLLSMGLGSVGPAPIIDFWPEQERWQIPRSTLQVDDAP